MSLCELITRGFGILILLLLLPLAEPHQLIVGTVHIPIPDKQYTYAPPDITNTPFDQSRWQYKDFNNEVKCMAENMYYEASGQGMKGKLAVGLVTITRVLHKGYPNSICKVVWQQGRNKDGVLVGQFSWTVEERRHDEKSRQSWEDSKRLAAAMLAERSLFNIYDFTNGATHYHAHYVAPWWSKVFTLTVMIGDHLFYQDFTVAIPNKNIL